MSEEKKEQPQEPRQAEVEFVVPDPDSSLFTAYANNVQIGWTYYDLRMMFGEVVEVLPEKIVIEQRAQITVSYLQAKVLVHLLSQAVAKHESIFGEIKLTPDMFGVNVMSVVAKNTSDVSTPKP